MKCPTCGKPSEWKDNPFRPFCSERCQLVDLSRWVEGEYRVPGEPIPQEQNGQPPAANVNEEEE